ncbi:MAG: hypothetical protein MUP58_03260 [Candidatus Nanohaloarchaeota archaeon QJJ-9]|nr:hypothetical protein [Candidatus Nanohaloarchaeota archaeon QJJ-9]
MSAEKLQVRAVTEKEKEDKTELDFKIENRTDEKIYEFVKLYAGGDYIDLKYINLPGGGSAKASFEVDKGIMEENPKIILSTEGKNKGVFLKKTLGEIEELGKKENPPEKPQESESKGEDTEVSEGIKEDLEKAKEKGIPEKRWEELKEEYEVLQKGDEKKEVLDKLQKEYKDLKKNKKQGKQKQKSKDKKESSEHIKSSVEEKVRDLSQKKEEEKGFLKSITDKVFGETKKKEEKEEENVEEILEKVKDEGKEPDKKEIKEEIQTETQKTQEKEKETPKRQKKRISEENLAEEKKRAREKDFKAEKRKVGRVQTGVIGLDQKMQGGFVEGTMNLITGKTGTGKTAFCASFLKKGVENGEPGVYVTTEEREEDIKADVESMFGWDLDKMEENGMAKILSIKPIFPSKEIDNLNRLVRSYISDLLDQVVEAVEEIDADRVIIDSVSIIEMFIRDEYMARVALASLLNNLREEDVTALLTGTIPETSEGLSGGGIIEFLVDAVLLLEFVPVAEDYDRTLTIRKMRRTDHEVAIFPFDITDNGLKIMDIQG